MLVFVATESGKMEAEGGAHDDTVMALALAAYASEGKWTPCEAIDDLYSKAI